MPPSFGSKQIIRGLMQELIDGLLQKASLRVCPRCSNFVATVIAFDAEAMKEELECKRPGGRRADSVPHHAGRCL